MRVKSLPSSDILWFRFDCIISKLWKKRSTASWREKKLLSYCMFPVLNTVLPGERQLATWLILNEWLKDKKKSPASRCDDYISYISWKGTVDFRHHNTIKSKKYLQCVKQLYNCAAVCSLCCRTQGLLKCIKRTLWICVHSLLNQAEKHLCRTEHGCFSISGISTTSVVGLCWLNPNTNTFNGCGKPSHILQRLLLKFSRKTVIRNLFSSGRILTNSNVYL